MINSTRIRLGSFLGRHKFIWVAFWVHIFLQSNHCSASSLPLWFVHCMFISWTRSLHLSLEGFLWVVLFASEALPMWCPGTFSLALERLSFKRSCQETQALSIFIEDVVMERTTGPLYSSSCFSSSTRLEWEWTSSSDARSVRPSVFIQADYE